MRVPALLVFPGRLLLVLACGGAAPGKVGAMENVMVPLDADGELSA